MDARKTKRSNTGVLRAESDAADANETAPYPTEGVFAHLSALDLIADLQRAARAEG